MAEAVESVLGQNLVDFELIIISEYENSRRCLDILHSFDDPRIRLIQNERPLGFVESVNLGLKLARGKYIARIDSDDFYLPFTLSTLFNFMEAHPKISFCHARQRFSNGDLTTCLGNHEAIKAGLLLNWVINHPYFWRREDFLEHGFFFDPSQAMEDYALMAKAVRKLQFASLPDVLYVYRINPSSITNSKMARLAANSADIIADNLCRTLEITIPEQDRFLFQMWRDPCAFWPESERRGAHSKLLDYFDLILRQNLKLNYYDQAALWQSVRTKHEMSVGGSLPLGFNLSGWDQSFTGKLKSLWQRGQNWRDWPNIIQVSLCRMALKIIRPFWRFFWKYFQPYLSQTIQTHQGPLQAQLDELNWRLNRQNRSHNLQPNIYRKINSEISKNINQLRVDIFGMTEAANNAVISELRSADSSEQVASFITQENAKTIKQIASLKNDLQQNFDRRIWKAEQRTYERLSNYMSPVSAEGGVLLVNDTFNIFHHGCSATSMAIRMQLESQCHLSIVPWVSLIDPQVSPKSYQEFISYEFMQKWMQVNSKIIQSILAADHVVINGEGSVSRYGSGTRSLFYLMYVSSKILGKKTSIINHSVYTSNYAESLSVNEQNDFINIIKCAYSSLANCWVREEKSLEQLERVRPGVGKLSFDCLPLYIQKMYPHYGSTLSKNGILVSGGNFLGDWYLDFLSEILPHLEVAVGSTALKFLFSDIPYSERSGDMDLYKKIASRFGDKVHLLAAKTTDEWLQAIQSASIFISGRFHHSMACFMLDTPFMAFRTDTKKMEGMLMGIEKTDSLLESDNVELAIHQARSLLANPSFLKENSSLLKQRILEKSALNFDFNSQD